MVFLQLTNFADKSWRQIGFRRLPRKAGWRKLCLPGRPLSTEIRTSSPANWSMVVLQYACLAGRRFRACATVARWASRGPKGDEAGLGQLVNADGGHALLRQGRQ